MLRAALFGRDAGVRFVIDLIKFFGRENLKGRKKLFAE